MFQGNSRGSVDYALRVAAEIMLIIFLFLELYSTWIRDYERAENTTVEYFYITQWVEGGLEVKCINKRVKQKCLEMKKKKRVKKSSKIRFGPRKSQLRFHSLLFRREFYEEDHPLIFFFFACFSLTSSLCSNFHFGISTKSTLVFMHIGWSINL